MITDSLTSTFRSERLIYVAAENNEEMKRFIHTEVDNNPVNIALGDLHVIRPANMTHADWVVDQLAKSDLGVILYLQAPPTVSTSGIAPTPFNPIPIGYMAVGWGGRSPTQSHHRSTSIGISLAEPYQNKGYGKEAINWALDWAFRFGGFHRVELSTTSYNERASHLYKKLGFVEEGRSREAYWYDRKWYDVISYGMLEGEWATLRNLDV
ncbi:hypothetical protein G7Z17_g5865 [Cylindrodendrum hubeiense]|uniref:N-acetyltransferase domain-containing protein n=1 Tax=Cylindrodendrum hubeiense TaxID=595255 RepID=A0A9P5HB30_9HYPO|nr:hypothetical protein G7Z17_g5865 [Cylindrodendrum hubeiense]